METLAAFTALAFAAVAVAIYKADQMVEVSNEFTPEVGMRAIGIRSAALWNNELNLGNLGEVEEVAEDGERVKIYYHRTGQTRWANTPNCYFFDRKNLEQIG